MERLAIFSCLIIPCLKSHVSFFLVLKIIGPPPTHSHFLLLTAPKWIKPLPDFSKQPLRLLYFDGDTFSILLKQLRSNTNTSENANNNNTQQRHNMITKDNNDNDDKDAVILLTQIKDTAHEKDAKLVFPLQSPADQVGQYKVSPLIHAGYATTWFALSASGMYMMRIMLTRGRG